MQIPRFARDDKSRNAGDWHGTREIGTERRRMARNAGEWHGTRMNVLGRSGENLAERLEGAIDAGAVHVAVRDHADGVLAKRIGEDVTIFESPTDCCGWDSRRLHVEDHN